MGKATPYHQVSMWMLGTLTHIYSWVWLRGAVVDPALPQVLNDLDRPYNGPLSGIQIALNRWGDVKLRRSSPQRRQVRHKVLLSPKNLSEAQRKPSALAASHAICYYCRQNENVMKRILAVLITTRIGYARRISVRS